MEKVSVLPMDKDQRKTPLFDAILGYIRDGVIPMHIPSHKQGRGIHPRWKEFAGENIFKMDLTEVEGLDDLHQAKDVIREAEGLAADAWGADRSYFLVNGTTAGIQACLITLAGENDEFIVPRNAHKSVLMGLIISGARPVYISAEIHHQLGLVGGVRPERVEEAFRIHPKAKGVLAVSPTYYGVCSDLKGIAQAAHSYNAALIADEAHGGHVYFHPDLPPGALRIGADASVQSTHKMVGSLTQSSLLHLKGDKLDRVKLKANLQLVQTTSPSYLLMASLDLARSYIATEGEAILERLIEMADAARKRLRAIPGIECLGPEIVGSCGITHYDPVRLVISARQLGIEGYELQEMLRRNYNIEMELSDYFYAVAVLGLGTVPEHLELLIKAMEDIALRYRGQKGKLTWDEELPPIPPQAMVPREAYFADCERVPWEAAKGQVAAEMVAPYPPGVPIICPGEIVTEQVWEYLEEQRRTGRHLHGPVEGKLDYFRVVK